MTTEQCKTLYDLHCKGEFKEIKDSIIRIEKAIIGNGKDGLTICVDRNTVWRKGVSWVLGAFFTVVVLGTIIVLIRAKVQ